MNMQLSSRFDHALTFASDLHRKQFRKGSSVPYICHLLGVCSLVLEYGGDEDSAIAALLHDAIEDQGGLPTRDKIKQNFGENVTAIVEACSDAYEKPKPPWRERKEAYINHVPNMSDQAALVSAADKLHNVRSIIKDWHEIGEKIWDVFSASKEETLWYYRELAVAFYKRKPTPIAIELKRTVRELETLSTDL
ncbi:HD domain-containing protein [Euhalothece natronophila]|nr:HD domain-containing protein [Euhalothece natronophila]